MKVQLVGSRIFIDTAPFIYYLEGNSSAAEALDGLFRDMGPKTRIFTSTITLSELLLEPFRDENIQLAAKCHLMLTYSQDLKIHTPDQTAAERAAQLKASYKLSTASALQLATAIVHKADFFLTHDERLKIVKEITVVTIKDL